jgi:hypothetical protein
VIWEERTRKGLLGYSFPKKTFLFQALVTEEISRWAQNATAAFTHPNTMVILMT